MMNTLPVNNQYETSQDFPNRYLKTENDDIFKLKAELIQSEIHTPQVKVKSDQDGFSWSQGDYKEELLDLGLQIKKEAFGNIPTGLIPPIEMDEEFEMARNTHASFDKNLTRSSRGSKGYKTTKSFTKKPNASSKKVGWSAEQTGNPDLSKGKTCCFTPDTMGKDNKSNKLHKENLFSCETCGKEFHQSALLADHVKIHRRQKPYTCNQCHMKFAKPSYLTKHLRRHAGERPFSCDCCEKTFFEIYDLRVHQRDHTGERPYLCSQCGKGFKRIYTLNKHKQTHSSEKPFQCSMCDKAYKYEYSYRRHMKDHINDVHC
ncbi:zinc finger protein 22 [Triplophysa rosa]|nr:zinc finger protein 22 [Triplophysa rosa]XP_057198413.1 zinc finger protein 22 [Triplophysa rosa]